MEMNDSSEPELANVRWQKICLERENLRLQLIAQEQRWTAHSLKEEQRLKKATGERRQQDSTSANPAGVEEAESMQQEVPLAIENAQSQVDTPKANGAATKIHQTLPASSRAVLGANGAVSEPGISEKSKGRRSEGKTPPMDESKEQRFEWSIVDFILEENSVDATTASQIFKCFEDGNTIPFMARYRKSVTQGMETDKLRNIKNSYDAAKSMKQRVTALFETVKGQGNCTPEFQAFLQKIHSLADFKHVRSIFKVPEPTLVQRTRYEALGKTARDIAAGENIVLPLSLVQPGTEGLENVDQVKLGLVYIMADIISKDSRSFDIIKKLRPQDLIQIETKLAKLDPKVPLTTLQEFTRQAYALYNNFVSTMNHLSNADATNIKRGEEEKVLVVQIKISPEFDRAFKDRCFQLYKINSRTLPLQRELITAAVDQVSQKWIHPFIMNKTRAEMNEKAEISVVENIVENVKRRFLTPPVRGKIVIGIFSVSLWVCKLAAVSIQGDFLESETICLHNADNPGAKDDAEKKLVQMVRKYKCTSLAVGSGTACRENVDFLTNLIQKKAFGALEVSYRIINDAGLIFYSGSREATEEFPTVDGNVIAAVSLARRLQDPIAELGKIETHHLAEEMHQQNVPEKKLIKELNKVITEVVSFAGVEINTASVSLLKRVAGLDEEKARNIIEWRKEFGLIRSRKNLMGIKGITTKTFEQCAGFIKIFTETVVKDGQRVPQTALNRLDQTWIHPQHYDVAEAFLEAANCNIDKLGTSLFTFAVQLYADQDHEILAEKFGTTADVIELIVSGLTMKTKPIERRAASDYSVKTNPPPAEHPKERITFDNLTVGTVLTGVITNILKDFGAFVNVGLGRDGVIHDQTMHGMRLRVGQKVETSVLNFDKERRRLRLRLRKCI